MASTDDTFESPAVLKTDQLGRVRTPTARREAILDEFERSGMSGQAFAKRCGIKYPTFASWVQRRNRARKVADTDSSSRGCDGGGTMTFLEATISAPAPEGSAKESWIELESPDGFKVRLQHREQIALAVECLKTLKRC